MENIIERIKDFLETNRYKILEMDDKEHIVIRYQLNAIHILHSDGDDEFVSLILSVHDEQGESDPDAVNMRCAQTSKDQKIVKAYTIAPTTVVMAYEFFCQNEEELHYQIEKGLNALMSCKRYYNKLKG